MSEENMGGQDGTANVGNQPGAQYPGGFQDNQNSYNTYQKQEPGPTSAYSQYEYASQNTGSGYSSSSYSDYGQGGQASPQPQYSQYSKKEPSKSKGGKGGVKSFLWGLIGVIVGAALVFGGCFAFGAFGNGQQTQATTTSSSNNGTINIEASGTDIELPEAVAAKCLPSVVSIDVYSQSQMSGFQGLMGQSSSGKDQESDLQESALGSGVIIQSDGYILTNYHVIAEGTTYVVHFDDDSSAEATVVGYDESSDLAVLKVDKTGLTAMEIGDSSDVTVGQWVMALGSPFGLTKSVTTGIISALYRNESMDSSYGTSFYINMMQIDASINPGNSGGALVDANGKLIGINTMISSYSGDSAGVGFAIPSNFAMNVANQIITTGHASHPYIGVTLGTVDAGTQEYYGTKASSGAYVNSVVKGSPAEAAGIQEGDVITSFNGQEVTTASELIIDVRSCNIGDTVEMGIDRNGQQVTVSITLGSDDSQ